MQFRLLPCALFLAVASTGALPLTDIMQDGMFPMKRGEGGTRVGVPPFILNMSRLSLPDGYCESPVMSGEVDRLLAGREIGLPRAFDGERDWLLFLRIQKTGSTTMDRYLRPLFRPYCKNSKSGRCGCSKAPELKDFPPAARCMMNCPTCRLVTEMHFDSHSLLEPFNKTNRDKFEGHPKYPIAPEHRPALATILRDPIARAQSEMKHILSHVEWRCMHGRPGLLLKRFLITNETCNGGWNRQVKMMAGFGGWEHHGEYVKEHVRSEEELLRRAVDVMLSEDTVFVGLNEQFSESLSLLSASIGLQPLKSFATRYDVSYPLKGNPVNGLYRKTPFPSFSPYWDKVSRELDEGSLSEAELYRILLIRNDLDIKLYCTAKRVLNERLRLLRERGDATIAEYECRLHEGNKVYGQCVSQRR